MADVRFQDGTVNWRIKDLRKDGDIASTLSNGLMSKEDKIKLDSIENNATKNIQGTNVTIANDGSINVATASKSTLGVVKIGDNININNGTISISTFSNTKDGLVPKSDNSTNKYLRADGEWEVPIDNNTTYLLATTTTNGLMSSSDKNKLDNIDTIYATKDDLNNYTNTNTLNNNYAKKTDLDDYAKLSDISTISGGDKNVIESISLNGTVLSINDKRVNIVIADANSENGGLMTNSQVNKLDSIESNAEVNKINSIKIENGPTLTISNKTVTIPIATGTDNGLMTSAQYNQLANLTTTGEVNTINTISIDGSNNKITPDGNRNVNLPLASIYVKKTDPITLGTSSSTVEGALWVEYDNDGNAILKNYHNGNSLVISSGEGNSSMTQIPIPSISDTIIRYTGSQLTPTWLNYNSSQVVMEGETKATTVGTHTVTVTPRTNYCWTDNTTDPKELTWEIERGLIVKPTVNTSTTIYYDGSLKTPNLNNYTSSKIILGGQSSQTEIGNYTATATPGNNYCWSDDLSQTSINLSWSIAKGPDTITMSPSNINSIEIYETKTITLSNRGGGTFSVESSAPEYISASIDNNTLTLTGLQVTQTPITITISCGDSDKYNSTSKTISFNSGVNKKRGEITLTVQGTDALLINGTPLIIDYTSTTNINTPTFSFLYGIDANNDIEIDITNTTEQEGIITGTITLTTNNETYISGKLTVISEETDTYDSATSSIDINIGTVKDLDILDNINIYINSEQNRLFLAKNIEIVYDDDETIFTDSNISSFINHTARYFNTISNAKTSETENSIYISYVIPMSLGETKNIIYDNKLSRYKISDFHNCLTVDDNNLTIECTRPLNNTINDDLLGIITFVYESRWSDEDNALTVPIFINLYIANYSSYTSYSSNYTNSFYTLYNSKSTAKNILSIPACNTLEKLLDVVKNGNSRLYFETGDYFDIEIDPIFINNKRITSLRATCIGIDNNERVEGINLAHFCFLFNEVQEICGFPAVKFNDTSTEQSIKYRWSQSYIRNYLNTTFYNSLPTDLKSIIPKCYKVTNEWDGVNTELIPTVTKDRIWLVSTDELESYDYLRKNALACESPNNGWELINKIYGTDVCIPLNELTYNCQYSFSRDGILNTDTIYADYFSNLYNKNDYYNRFNDDDFNSYMLGLFELTNNNINIHPCFVIGEYKSPNLSLSNNSITLNDNNSTEVISISCDSPGNISIIDNAQSICNIEYNDNDKTITISKIENGSSGTAEITVVVEATETYEEDNAVITVICNN